MKDNNIDDQFLQEIMSKSKLQVPFSDFEENVMRQIETRRIKSASRDVKLSWIFFVMGTVFGILISLLLTNSHYTFTGFDLDKLRLPFQILFILLFVTQINNLIDFYKKTNITKRN
jgi:hypothetical protein